jgi:hypothetical protein
MAKKTNKALVTTDTEIQKSLAAIGLDQERINKYIIQYNKELRKSSDLLTQQKKIQSDFIDKQQTKLETEQEVNQLYNDITKLQKKGIGFLNQSNNLNDHLRDTYKTMMKQQTLVSKANFDIVKLEAQMFKQLSTGNVEIFNSELELLKIRQKYPKLQEIALENISEALNRLQETNNAYIKNKDTIDALNTELSQSQEYIDEIKKKAMGWYGITKQLVKGHGAQLYLMGALAKKTMEFKEDLADAQKSMGLTLGQTADMAGIVSSSAFSSGILSGASMKETAEAYQAIVEHTGDISKATKEQVGQVAALSSLYGVNVEQGAALMHITEMTGGYDMDIAKGLAKANKVPIGAMMKDVAENTELFATFGKDGGDNIFKASVFAKKLGLDLGKVSAITDSLLKDPTASIEAEMNASVLLGKQLDMNGVRQKLYNDDQVGAMKDIMNQLGGIDKFNKMDYYQKNAIADLLGVQVADVQKMAAAQSDGKVLADGTWEATDKTSESMFGLVKSTQRYGLLLASAAGTIFQSLPGLKLMKDHLKDMGGITGALKNAWSSIKGLFGAGKGGAEAMSGVRNIGGKTLTKNIGGAASKGAGDMDMKNASKPADMSKSMGKINMKDVVMGALAMAIMAAALYIFAQALVVFNNVQWSSVLKGAFAMGILVGALAAVGGIMSAFSWAILIGAAVILVLAAAFWVFAQGLLVAATALSSFPDFKTLIGLAAGLSVLGLALIPFSLGMIALGLAAPFMIGGALAMWLFGKSIEPFANSLEKVGQSLPVLTNFLSVFGSITSVKDGVTEFFDNVSDGIDNLVVSLKALSPYSSTLQALSNIGGGTGQIGSYTATGTIANNSTSSGGGNSDKLLSEVSAKLDTLISVVSSGAYVEIDGVKFLRYLTKVNPALGNNSSYSTGKGSH